MVEYIGILTESKEFLVFMKDTNPSDNPERGKNLLNNIDNIKTNNSIKNNINGVNFIIFYIFYNENIKLIVCYI